MLKKIDKWNKEMIDKRGEELYKLASQIWPYPNVKPNEKNIDTQYYLLSETDEIEFTNTKITRIIVKGLELDYNSWVEAFLYIIRQLYKENKDLFVSIIENDEIVGTIKNLFSFEKSKLRTPFEIGDGLFCETNLNTMRKIEILKKLTKQFQYEEEDVIVYIK